MQKVKFTIQKCSVCGEPCTHNCADCGKAICSKHLYWSEFTDKHMRCVQHGEENFKKFVKKEGTK